MLEQYIQPFITQYGTKPSWWVAYSGGLDSHVLLHLMHRLKQQYGITCHAIHINHQLHPKALQWQQHCQRTCHQLDIPCTAMKLDLKPKAQDSLEALAREGRYRAFQTILKPNDILLTAHHQQDQAETLLLQLLRGAGPKGLASMPNSRTLGAGLHIRPLLGCAPEHFHHYAQQYGLHWIEDPSNENHRFDRNYLRHEIIPKLMKRWPQTLNNLQRSAQHCADADQGLHELAKQDASMTHTTLCIKTLKQYVRHRRNNVLRHWVAHHHYPLPSTKQLDEIDRLLFSKSDKQPILSIKGYEIRRYRQQLHLLPPVIEHPVPSMIHWNCQAPLTLPHNLGTLHPQEIRQKIPKGIDLNTINIRFRQGGEKIEGNPNQPRKRLKTFFQEQGVPPWLRGRIPLIYTNDRLLFPVLKHKAKQDSGI